MADESDLPTGGASESPARHPVQSPPSLGFPVVDNPALDLPPWAPQANSEANQ